MTELTEPKTRGVADVHALRSSTGTAVAHVLAWTALTIPFTLLVLQYSLNRGKLIVPAHYDDVSYLRDGLAKLDGFYRGGIGGLAARASQHPPHSPFGTLTAFAGFAIFGVHDWAPYAANGIIIFTLLAFTDWLTRGMRPWQKLLAFLFVLSVPISAQAVYEFRPDIFVGLVTTVVIVMLLEKPLVSAPRGYLETAGLIAAVALLSKTSIFPITLGLVGAALLAASIRDRLLLGSEARANAFIKAWARLLLPVLLIPLPWYLYNRHEIYFYITVNALGGNSDIWKVHAGLAEQLLFYATGHFGGGQMLGRHLMLMSAVLLVGAFAAITRCGKKGTLRVACYAFVGVVAYVGPTLNPIKDAFLGVVFDFILISATLLVFRALLSAFVPGPVRSAGIGALICMVVIGAWFAKWPMYWGDKTDANVVMRNRYVNDLYSAIRSHDPQGDGIVLVAVTGVFANADALGYLADKDDLTKLDFVSDFANKDFGAINGWLDRCRFVVAGDPGNPEDDPNTPYSAMLDRSLSAIRSRPDFRLVQTCPTLAGKNYYVFQHVPART